MTTTTLVILSLGTAWAVVAVVDGVRFYRRRNGGSPVGSRPTHARPVHPQGGGARAAAKARAQVASSQMANSQMASSQAASSGRRGPLVGPVRASMGAAPAASFTGGDVTLASWLGRPAVVRRRRIVAVLLGVAALSAVGVVFAASLFTLVVHLVADAALVGYLWLLARAAARRRALEMRR